VSTIPLYRFIASVPPRHRRTARDDVVPTADNDHNLGLDCSGRALEQIPERRRNVRAIIALICRIVSFASLLRAVFAFSMSFVT
jgi:hypothetical protein